MKHFFGCVRRLVASAARTLSAAIPMTPFQDFPAFASAAGQNLNPGIDSASVAAAGELSPDAVASVSIVTSFQSSEHIKILCFSVHAQSL